MIEFGSIVLTRFPFTDLSGTKFRPALVISRDNARRSDVVPTFITSKPHTLRNPRCHGDSAKRGKQIEGSVVGTVRQASDA
jgi:hypothetical protein